jgi:phosphatidylglycerol:prolipoprotein diacylglycerol transferase
MLHYPGFDPIAFQVGPLAVRWYGIMYLIGFAAAWWLARRRAAQPGSTWSAQDVDDVIFFAMLGVIFGGRIGYVFFYGLGYWAEDPFYPLRIAVAVFAWRRKRRVADVFDFMAPLPGIGLFAGRIGNFVNGELWGSVTTVPWGFVVDGQVRHATQLYEATLEGLLLFAILWWYTSRPRPRLAPSGLFLVVYSLARMLVEFWRVPDQQIGYFAEHWLTMGQLLSLPMLLAGIAMLAYAHRRREPSGNLSAP